MKAIIVSGSVTLLLAVVFVLGFATNTPGLAAIAFCGWTPAVFILGAAVGRARVRLVVTADVHSGSDEIQPRVRRIS